MRQPRFGQDQFPTYSPGVGAYEILAVDGTVKQPTVPAPSIRIAKVYFRQGPVRVTFDGSTPSATNGVPFYDGDKDEFSRAELLAMKLTREGAGSNGEVHLVYYN